MLLVVGSYGKKDPKLKRPDGWEEGLCIAFNGCLGVVF